MANHSTLNQENLVERISSLAAVGGGTPTYLVSPSNNTASLLEINANSFSSADNTTFIQQQQNNGHLPHSHHSATTATSSTSSYTFLQIKREPCQVSEITTSNNLSHHQQQQQHHQHHQHQDPSSGKTLSSSLTTVVKIESSSPKTLNSNNINGAIMEKNNVPVGIAIARKRQQEQSTIPTSLQRDCFGIRVGDLNTVAPPPGCANIFFTGNELTTNANPESIMNSSGMQNVGRAASSFWQYPSSAPLDSVLSMPLPPAGFQYARDPNRGQLLLFPAPSSGIEPMPQAYVWPSFMHTGTNALQAAAPNFLFPPLTSTTTTAAPQSQQSPFVPFQLYGSNYLATASTTLHHHTQTHGTRLVAFSAPEAKQKSHQMQAHSMLKHTNNTPVMKIEDWSSNQQHSGAMGNFSKSVVLPQHQQTHSLQNFSTNVTNFIEIDKDKMPLQLNTTPSNIVNSPPVIEMPVIHNPVIPSISNSESNTFLQPTLPTSQQSLPLPPLAPLSNNLEANDSNSSSNNNINLNNNNSAIVYKPPEMQDVNIQTDTPIMSEEENTLGPDECVFPNKIESNNAVITSSTEEDIIKCNQNINHQDSQTDMSEEVSPQLDDIISQQSEEMTGLELLCNISTTAANKVIIKQEKIEEHQVLEQPVHTNISSMLPCEPLGGLKLLCALAEQRINEEAEKSLPKSVALSYQTLNPPTSPPIEDETFCEDIKEKEKPKKKKRKHSKSKSSRKKGGNCNSSSKSKKHSRHEANPENMEDLSSAEEPEIDMKSAFKKVQYKFMKHHKCSHSEKHCRAKCNWPDPEEFFKAMESDMRTRLADITRQYRKKKRKLHAFNKIQKKNRKHNDNNEQEHDSTLPFNHNKHAHVFGEKSPFIISENDDTHMSSDREREDAEASSFLLANQTNTWKSLGIDMMRNKKLNQFKFEEAKAEVPTKKIKEENSNLFEENDESRPHSSNSVTFTKAKQQHKKQHKIKEEIAANITTPTKSSTIVLKSPTLAQFEKQKEINQKLMLTNEHLYKNKIRVLTDMGGLFYAGYLSPLQPPDVYAVALDGERGNKSHIMSREEVLKDTILELAPTSYDEVRPGTRLCAYWSQQYRCLYPGRAAVLPDNQENNSSSTGGSTFISVEFDDGDSGKIRLENIRFLLSDYPNVEYDTNPLGTFGKIKRRLEKNEPPECSVIQGSSAFAEDDEEDEEEEDEDEHDDKEAMKEEIEKITLEEDKKEIVAIDTEKEQPKNVSVELSEQSEEKSLCRRHKSQSDESRKHRKHKKRKKHKKHHRKMYEIVSSSVEISKLVDETETSQESVVQSILTISDETPVIDEIQRKVLIEDTDEQTSRESYTQNESLLNGNADFSKSNLEKNDEKKVRSHQDNHSKIAAFLPARQLWKWLGVPYKKPAVKGRSKKSFYRSIQRGKEIITIGDSAVFLSTGRPDRPYIGRIESMWESSTSNKVVRVKWFYHPEETVGCPELKFPGALFESPHEDENDVQTISHKCEVLAFAPYEQKFGPDPSQYQFIYDNNDTYYLAGHYNPKSQSLKLDSNTPISNNNL